MEAQRYPEDFDAIVAGAPACNWTEGKGGGSLVINRAMCPEPEVVKEPTIRLQDQELRDYFPTSASNRPE
jgi:hypothetical protein